MKRPSSLTFAALLLALSLVLSACGTNASGEKVVVVTDATWPPFEMLNEKTKEFEGFDIDLMNAIAEEAGLNVEYQNVAWDPLLAGMATCQYDAAISAMTITEDRAKDFLFSEPYFEAGQVVVVTQDNTEITGPESLAGKKAGAQIGTTGAIEIAAMEGVDEKTFDDIALAFQDLMNGQIDAVVADNPLAIDYVHQNEGKIKIVGDVFTDENYGIAVCKQKPELLAKINEGLAAVKANGTLDKLAQKWELTATGQ